MSTTAEADRKQLIACVELLFFAYRDFTGDPDAVLAEYGFGRAHHRVLHFVNRHPGLRVADLLDILKITKQSLARVLKQLVDEGFIVQRAGENDRRERRLYSDCQGRPACRQAYGPAGQAHRAGSCRRRVRAPTRPQASFLFAMIAEADRARVESC